jgi:hypothetical protein
VLRQKRTIPRRSRETGGFARFLCLTFVGVRVCTSGSPRNLVSGSSTLAFLLLHRAPSWRKGSGPSLLMKVAFLSFGNTLRAALVRNAYTFPCHEMGGSSML